MSESHTDLSAPTADESGANMDVKPEVNGQETSVAMDSSLPQEPEVEDDFRLSDRVQSMVARSNKNIVSLFGEMHTSVYGRPPNIYVQVQPGDPPNNIMFLCSIVLGTTTVTGIVRRRKKDAKTALVRRAMQVLCDIIPAAKMESALNIRLSQPNTLFELIRQHTYAKFYALCVNNPKMIGCEKVISSIFLYNSSTKSMQILSLATGNKTIKGDSLSLSGTSVNDCHAEILARRGMLRFLYAQLLQFNRCPENSIFCPHDSGKLMVRPCFSFHQYVNTAPCGDARVYGKEAKEGCDDNENAGRLRTKVERGMGTILNRGENSPQTIDGILGGERLLTMSCSAKMLRWNALGMQGALLSRLIQPIYLSSLTVANLLDKPRLSRAISERVEGIPLPEPFRLNTPLLGSCQEEATPNDVSRSGVLSSNWNVADASVELLCSASGRTIIGLKEREEGKLVGDESRLCKKAVVALYRTVCKELGVPIPSDYTYENLKVACEDYEAGRKIFNEWCVAKKLGHWRPKPSDISAFVV